MLTQFVNGQAAKSLVVILTSVATALTTYYGSAKWQPLVVLGVGIVVHYLVPNADPPAPVLPPLPPEPPHGM